MSVSRLSSGNIIHRHEVDDVVSLWEELRQGDAEVTIREFYGPPGIGKSELVKQIKEALQNRGVGCAYLNFAPFPDPWDPSVKNTRVEEIYSQPSLLFVDLYKIWSRLDSRKLSLALSSLEDGQVAAAEGLADILVRDIKHLSSDDTVVLLCDETDKINWEYIPWFEDNLVSQLAFSGRCLVVWVGRHKKIWRNTNLREKIRTTQLLEFSPDQVQEHLQRNLTVTGIPTDQILSITYGHPMAEDVAISYINKYKVKALDAHKNVLIKEIGRIVIDGYAIRDTVHGIQNWFPFSIPREYYPGLLQALLDDPVQSRPFYYYRQLIDKVIQSGLTELARNDLHCMSKPIRYIMHNYYRVKDEPGYLIGHRASLEVYKNHINRFNMQESRNNSWDGWALEAVYHIACLNQVKPAYNLREELKIILAQLDKSGIDTIEQQRIRDSLVHSIEDDYELTSLLPPDEIEGLLGII